MRFFPIVAALLLFPAVAMAVRPNVVIFLADDAGWGDFSHSGNTQVSTPGIDSIALRGVSLDRFYVSPVCSPTRAELLTGRYHFRGGVRGVSTGQERLNLDEKTLADAFKVAGYATGAFGKWHNGSQYPYHPAGRGFDEYFGHTSGHWGEYFDAPLEDNGRMAPTKGYIVDVCTDRALDFIGRHQDQPFFCFVAFTTPHSPWAVADADWQRFKALPITLPATKRSLEEPDHTRCALAMMENQDRNVRRVLAKLAEIGATDNTLVIYFSDNGPNSFRWNGGMKGKKGSTDEGGVRSVCYLSYPAKLPAGRVVDRIAGTVDLLPTITSLAGVARLGHKPLDGLDLTPLLAGGKVAWPDRFIVSSWGNQVSVRSQTHRLDSRGELYDMIADPGQTKPVNATNPGVAAELEAGARQWREEVAAARAKNGNPEHPEDTLDSRPFTVGYREFPITLLPARDGQPRGNVRRSSSAPNCSYFVNWTATTDTLVWNIDVHTAGRYAVAIDYTCPVPDAGSRIELSFKNARLGGIVKPGWAPPLYQNQDTLPRPAAESPMKEFRTLDLGEVFLPSGTGPLTLRALEIPGKQVMDLRRIILTLLDGPG
jgi:arylsulfatase A-like enzyme